MPRTASDERKGYIDICTLNPVPPSVPRTILNWNALLHRSLAKVNFAVSRITEHEAAAVCEGPGEPDDLVPKW